MMTTCVDSSVCHIEFMSSHTTADLNAPPDLRRLQAKLAALESLAKDAIADSKGEPRKAHEVVEGGGQEGEKKVSGTESPAAEIKRKVAEDHAQLRSAEAEDSEQEE